MINLGSDHFKKGWLLLLALSLIALSCADEPQLFTNPKASSTGIDFINKLTPTDELNILDYLYFYNGGGVAVGDINNDNLPDIYLSGNQVKNKLYLNQGNLKFKDITEIAGVAGKSSWNTGAVMGDVNNDGLLDIYVCAVVGLNGFRGYNELFINNGDTTFTESAVEYGLDLDTYSSSAVFLDYDLDGDLDIYILNHAVHTQESFGNKELRTERNYQTGDRLMRNDGGKFTDVSEAAGIFGGINGYGLGVSVSDFNKDGYPDIYVGNDFHEDDYFYINNGDGTFSEKLTDYFGHTSRFSMGNDVADINHDGWPDIISLDMLPEDEKILKSSESDEDAQIQKLRTERYGYHYQYTRNMLFINQPQVGFSETAMISGLAATDWSWSALFGDYNQDGELDLFVSNGIPKRPNDLDFIRFVSNDQIQKKISNTKLVDQEALNMMPSGSVSNYIFEGTKSLRFKDQSEVWIKNDTLVSGATAIADLDMDGDLDIVTNNINSPVTIYKNKTNATASYLKIKLRYKDQNPFGIGTKVSAYLNGEQQYREMYNVRGFQSSSEPIIHYGYGTVKQIDSLVIIWPDQTTQTEINIRLNQDLEISPRNVKPYDYKSLELKTTHVFEKDSTKLGIDFVHVEDAYLDFARQKLIPYSLADRGPATAIGDINGDGLDDVFFGGSKFVTPQLYLQTDSGFALQPSNAISMDSITENITAMMKDFNNDGRDDILVGNGGADFFGKSKPLLDKIYLQNDEGWENSVSVERYENTAIMKPSDFDKDGDLDVFVGNSSITGDFGNVPSSYILRNDNGKLSYLEALDFEALGMITDAIWTDFNSDGTEDLIVVGEWMSPKVLLNKNGRFTVTEPFGDNLNGLWRAIELFDFDSDGDIDILLGNWGLNSKFKVEDEKPIKMWYGDIDGNGQSETVIAINRNDEYYPIANLDELGSQMVNLRKKFTDNKSFAGKPVSEIFDEKKLSSLKIFEANVLASGVLVNDDGKYEFQPFKDELQLSPITVFLKFDFSNDGDEEVLAAGNYFGVTPYHGRFDSFQGAMIYSNKKIVLGSQLGLNFFNKSARHLNIIDFKNKPYLLATFNNDSLEVYKLKKYND